MTRLTQTRTANAAALQAEIDRMTAVLAQMRWEAPRKETTNV